MNKQNCRIWSREKPYIIRETHTQWPAKVNVWMGILGNQVIGAFFIDGCLNGQKYLDMLIIMMIGPALASQKANGQVIFQHDQAPSHVAREVVEFLNNSFSESWVGRNGPYKWAPRSPDLSPLDFSLWGFLASKVFDLKRPNPHDTEDLQERMIHVYAV